MTAAVPVARAVKAARGGGAAARGAGGRAGTAAKGSGAQARREAAEAFEAESRRPARTAADKQRAGIQRIKDSRPVEEPAASPAEPVEPVEEPAPVPAPEESSPSRQVPGSAVAGTGSGFLLGVFAWAVGLAYLQGGGDGVKQFLRAKFFNKVDA